MPKLNIKQLEARKARFLFDKDRFYACVNFNASQVTHVTGLSKCHEWGGAITGSGYGTFRISFGKTESSHRIAWMFEYGVIKQGLFVCHKCDNRRCVNVDHLFLGTSKDNQDDRVAKGRHLEARKTTCPKGHAYTEENTYMQSQKGKNPARICRTCSIDGDRERRAMKKYKAMKKHESMKKHALPNPTQDPAAGPA